MRVSSASRLYSAWRIPDPADITWSSPAAPAVEQREQQQWGDDEAAERRIGHRPGKPAAGVAEGLGDAEPDIVHRAVRRQPGFFERDADRDAQHKDAAPTQDKTEGA